jgi:hypothetical protein
MSSEEEINEICKQALERWGRDAQEFMMIEECAELIKAICKTKRCHSLQEYIDAVANVVEELGDVYLMHRQMLLLFVKNQNKEKDYVMIVENKLGKLKEKLK